MSSNDTKCEYMFMFPLQNLACKELKYCDCKEIICIQIEMTY